MLALLAAVALTWWTPSHMEAHIERTGIAWSFTGETPNIERVRNAQCRGLGRVRQQGAERQWNRFRCRIDPTDPAKRSYIADFYLGSRNDEILVLHVRWL